jgi:L-serine dehydratase
MQSIKEIFKVGSGPSSSHTMGPRKAAEIFKGRALKADSYVVSFYGSLAATGKGHLADNVVAEELGSERTAFKWYPDNELPLHPNGMHFEAFDKKGEAIDKWEVYSIGGGELIDKESGFEKEHIYKHNTMDEIIVYCDSEGHNFWEYVLEHESDIETYLNVIWSSMKEAIQKGLKEEGVLPGSLHLGRKAAAYNIKTKNMSGYLKKVGLLFSYALAVSEENAAGGRIVTAPTCGAAGVLPSVLFFLQENYDLSDDRIIHALCTAGIIGNVIKENASISGAEVGCQGEIGSACAMAAGAAAQLLGGSLRQIEYAAEMGMEHHLGLTCDPVDGLVQIPCIERNANGAVRALDCAAYALLSDGRHNISFDQVVNVMYETGQDLKKGYRETAVSGLAHLKRDPKKSQ